MSEVVKSDEEKRRDVFLSRASSRKELASTVHDLILPELQRLGGNDKVTQDVCKALVAGMKAQGEEIVRLSQRLTAIETMSFGARLRWAFTFSQPKKD
jgi:hypothetical protein